MEPDEPADAKNKTGLDSEVLVDSIDGACRIIDLGSVFSGTVVLVDYAEYMKLSEGIWIRHNGQKTPPNELASRIREAQDEDLPVILIHVG